MLKIRFLIKIFFIAIVIVIVIVIVIMILCVGFIENRDWLIYRLVAD